MRLASKIVVLFFGGLMLVLTSGISPAQKSQSSLNLKVSDYIDSDTDVSILLNRASLRLGIPIGLEVDGQLAPPEPLSIHVSNGTAADVFSDIVKRSPGYRWIEQDGVVDVLPKDTRESIMDVRIDHIQVSNGTPNDLRNAITSLPEVKAWLNANELVERSFNTPIIRLRSDGSSAEPRVTVDYRNMTLREIMNRIVTNSGLHVWSVWRHVESNRYLSIDIG